MVLSTKLVDDQACGSQLRRVVACHTNSGDCSPLLHYCGFVVQLVPIVVQRLTRRAVRPRVAELFVIRPTGYIGGHPYNTAGYHYTASLQPYVNRMTIIVSV